jgi:flagellar biosynthesis/type III secretory pathway protein FliH
MMNLQSEAQGTKSGGMASDGRMLSLSASTLSSFFAPNKAKEQSVSSPLVFRLLACESHFDEPGAVSAVGAELSHVQGVRDAAAQEAVDTAHAEGFRQGEHEGCRKARLEMEAELHAALFRERERVGHTVEQFNTAREQYFDRIEREVVKLALAIAGRVLHREAQVDPLLLSGVVHVALEKLADRRGVVLRVAKADVEGWERMFLATEQAQRPEIVADTTLTRGECLLETKMGTIELGVSVQLEEIERGFFDLLKQRPGMDSVR